MHRDITILMATICQSEFDHLCIAQMRKRATLPGGGRLCGWHQLGRGTCPEEEKGRSSGHHLPRPFAIA